MRCLNFLFPRKSSSLTRLRIHLPVTRFLPLQRRCNLWISPVTVAATMQGMHIITDVSASTQINHNNLELSNICFCELQQLKSACSDLGILPSLPLSVCLLDVRIITHGGDDSGDSQKIVGDCGGIGHTQKSLSW